ncbi:MAG: hypothetical protein IPK26_10225 [Planctomycetes bacterium]|nr:hypothetical protein [Planctomycetota bacterium]
MSQSQRQTTRLLLLAASTTLAVASARAQLSLVNQFASGVSPVSCAFDPATSTVFVYASFGADIRKYSTTGTPLGAVTRPGGSANDADLVVAPVAFTLGTTPVPAGALLYIDGESGVAEVHAIDSTNGTLLGSLTTGFGNSHVVGGAYHPLRGTLFLVQDRVPSNAAQKNLVAEVSATTGQVLGTFQTTATNPAFTVNFGDLDITTYGNLLIVSSDETEIGEFTPLGTWVRGHALPATVADPAGIGLDATGCGLWIASTNGLVSGLTASCPSAVTQGSGCPSSGGNNLLVASTLPWAGGTFVATATGLPGNAVAIAALGFSGLPIPLPLSLLLPQGQPGCNLHVQVATADLVPVVAGSASWQLALPADPLLVGLQFHQQMGVLELNAALAIVAATSTNALRLTIGSY